MIKTQYINLNMTPFGVLPVLYCSQYDVGRPLGMVVHNGGEMVDLDGYTCRVEATRTDGTAITAAVTTDGSIGAFETTATMTNKADHYLAKLVLVDGQSRRVASLTFVLCVTPATMDENAESIEEDKSLYQQYTGTVQTLIAEIREDLTDLKKDIYAEYRVINIASEERALCVALVDPDGHAILFDLSDETNASGVISALSGITNVDAVCISHFHHDHIGDYATIFSTLPHKDCVWYIPPVPRSGYGLDSVAEARTSLISWISEHGDTYVVPTENQTVNINKVKVAFNNCDHTYWYNNYTSETLNYNWLSITAYVKFAGIAMQIMGDLYTDGEKYFFNTLHAGKRAEIYQAPHHGLTSKFDEQGFISVNPNVVLANYGTNNDYIPTRYYSSGILGYCHKESIPAFDVVENGTYTIYVSNGRCYYDHLIPVSFNWEFKTFAALADAVYDNFDIGFTRTSGIKDVLQLMPVNSRIIFLCARDYQIATDLNLGVNSAIEITKLVGGSTNYLINRSNPDNFRFFITIYEDRSTTPTHVISGSYISGVWDARNVTISVPQCLGFAGKKNEATDTSIAITSVISTKSLGTLISVENNAVYVSRTGVYEVSFTANSESTSLDIIFNNENFYLRNGASVTRLMRLNANTAYTINCGTESTNIINGFVKLVGYYGSVLPSFPV